MKVDRLSRRELNEIAAAFADHKFQNGEKGSYYLCKGRQGRIGFVKGYAMFVIKSGAIYTTSQKREGYICIQTSEDKTSFGGICSFLNGVVKAMGIFGGIRWLINYVKGGFPVELFLRKRGYVHIRMLAVKKEYQGQGYMRRLVGIALALSKQRNVPCIVSTDCLDKAQKYEHFGFKLFRKRQMSENAYVSYAADS